MALTRLKQLREEAVLTVHELAEASGVSDDTISKIENGQRVARPNTLRKLASALGVSPQELRRPAKTEELAGAGKVEASQETGQPDEERSVRDIAHAEALRQDEISRKAIRRTLASEGIDNATRISDVYEPSVYDVLRRQPSDELAGALLDAERDCVRAAQEYALLQQKVNKLEEENAQLREEAKQESVHR